MGPTSGCGHEGVSCNRYASQSATNDDLTCVIWRKDNVIAINRFRVKRGAEGAFEKVWLSRDSYLDRVPGFVEFHLLKGPEAEDHTLYASHTVWQSKAAFEAWTKSEEFRAAHARAGGLREPRSAAPHEAHPAARLAAIAQAARCPFEFTLAAIAQNLRRLAKLVARTHATVLQLPASPRATNEAEQQKRGSLVT